MIKIFVTGDLHIGRQYDRYPDVQAQLLSSRFDCLRRIVNEAEDRGCDLLAITGDTFDRPSGIKVGDVRQVVEILSGFSGRVLLLPGNHDPYTENAKVWADFSKEMAKRDHNILLLNRFEPVPLEIGDEQACVWPAFCQSKHSSTNNLGWIKAKADEMDPSVYNIGMVHGAIQGITPDMKEEYFLMTEAELDAVPVDVWLIGHTHVPFPAMEPGEVRQGLKIFNPGTPEQLDLHNNTKGLSYVLTLEKSGTAASVTAEAVRTGNVSYQDIGLELKPDPDALQKALKEVADHADYRTVVRLTLHGAVTQTEYDSRNYFYSQALSKLMTYEVEDSELSVQITREKIRAEFPEVGFAAAVLEQLLDSPEELQMAYELLKECRE